MALDSGAVSTSFDRAKVTALGTASMMAPGCSTAVSTFAMGLTSLPLTRGTEWLCVVCPIVQCGISMYRWFSSTTRLPSGSRPVQSQKSPIVPGERMSCGACGMQTAPCTSYTMTVPSSRGMYSSTLPMHSG